MNHHTDPFKISALGQQFSIYAILSILLLLIAGALRFHDLPQRSLWYDEAVAANNSTGTIAQTIENTQHRNSSPIIYPLILLASQKVEKNASNARFPSAVFSLLAVLIILIMPRVGMDRRAAFIAATVLTLSASQIRYAQEVREYSFSVLLATMMIYGLLACLDSHGRKRATLYVSLFAAPLVQYGLVLFGFAVIGTLGLTGLIRRRPFIGDTAKAGIALTLGGVISFMLTLRHQWWGNNANAHLQEYFFNGNLIDLTSVITFLAGKTYSLLKYLLLGEVIVGLFLVTFIVYVFRFILRNRKFDDPLVTLFIFSFAIIAAAALVDAYPLGATRQCLYLAPVAALAFGSVSITVSSQLKGRAPDVWTGLVMIAVVIFGTINLQAKHPYREVEDINSVLSHLQASKKPEDAVYVYFAAKPALKFYDISGDRFLLGGKILLKGHEIYIDEICRAMELGSGRLWIILSHMKPDVEEFIVSETPQDWHLEKRVGSNRASLYLATKPTDQ